VRASHPGTARSVRLLASTVVRSCEHLLHGAGFGEAEPDGVREAGGR
jgi:hypothetical protein